MTDLLRYVEHVNVLKRLPRTGWLLNGVTPCESVADHTAAVGLLALALAAEVNQDWAGEGLQGPLDLGRVAQVALVHDLAESVLTDLPRRTALLLGEDVKHAAEAAALQGICAEVPDGEQWLAWWDDYNRSRSPEARLVRDADKLEMVHQALVYARAGNRSLAEFWAEPQWAYAASARLFAALRLQRG